MQDKINEDSWLCCGMWGESNKYKMHFPNYRTVNHSENFLEPPRNQDPLWIEKIGLMKNV